LSTPPNFWRHERELVSDPFTITKLAAVPVPPSDSEVQSVVTAQLNQGIGEFVRKVVDAGYSVTIQDYGYGYFFEYVEGGIIVGSSIPVYWAKYRFHLTFYVEYVSNAPSSFAQSLLGPLGIFIIWIVVILGTLIIAGIAVNNLTSKTEVDEEWGWQVNPNTGIAERVLISRKTSTGPPDWWAYIIPIIALGGIVLLFPSLITGLRGAFEKKREQPLRDKQGRILW